MPSSKASSLSSIERIVAARPSDQRFEPWYRIAHAVFVGIYGVCYGLRVTGRENVPRRGGVLIASNHQSFWDPMLLGVALWRKPYYLARESLWNHPLLGRLLNTVHAFPIRHTGVGLQGLKDTIRLLQRGEVVVMFPEGTRTRDGAVAPLRPGISLLVQKARVPVVPAAIEGAFEAWPRNAVLPGLHPIRVHYGPPILPETVQALDGRAVSDLIRERILECQASARRAAQTRRVPEKRKNSGVSALRGSR